MMKQTKTQVLAFHEDLDTLTEQMSETSQQLDTLQQEENSFREELNALLSETASLANQSNLTMDLPSPLLLETSSLNAELDGLCTLNTTGVPKKYSALQTVDMVFSAAAGLISAIVDVVFVGTPEVVKIWRSGEQFDGSRLTGLLRTLGQDDGNLSPIFQWLEAKCKVPYDIPLAKGVMSPNDHRLKSLAHDPFFGLFFAVSDILMGTTTCVGNDGKLHILISHSADSSQQLLPVFYFIGHLLSDVCTSRGLPIPGFFLTQFFTGDSSESSIAVVARRMYRDGYDLRHLASMSFPVAAKDLLIAAYLYLTENEVEENRAFLSNAEREYWNLQKTIKKEKMLLIANGVATAGNLVKICAPPNYGNPCAINLAQWFSMIRSGVVIGMTSVRNQTTEKIIENRFSIKQTWEQLAD